MSANECNSIEQLMRLWQKKAPVKTHYLSNKQRVDIEIDHNNNFFIPDGIVDEKTWEEVKSGKRILLVLKEAYEDDHSKEQWSINKALRDAGPWGAIWNRVCEWTRGIHDTTRDKIAGYIPSDKMRSNGTTSANEWLRRIAVMNLKKSGGQSKSDYGEISAYANADAQEIIREIELIDPDIVVCGATFGDINRITGNTMQIDYDRRFCFSNVIGNKERLFIDFYHPANHFSALLNYYGIVGIYQQALNSK